jgi:F subunit of K+-transporting ATPase (Potass_KdpF)
VVVIRTLLCEVADFLIGGRYESLDLGPCVVSYWDSRHGPLLRVPFRLRKYVGEKLAMIYVTAIVAVFVFGYLVAAMVRPEWF